MRLYSIPNPIRSQENVLRLQEYSPNRSGSVMTSLAGIRQLAGANQHSQLIIQILAKECLSRKFL